MATVITFSTSDGIKGRCDAKCHYAREPECDCICGGMNHGCALKGKDPNEPITEALMKALEQKAQEENLTIQPTLL